MGNLRRDSPQDPGGRKRPRALAEAAASALDNGDLCQQPRPKPSQPGSPGRATPGEAGVQQVVAQTDLLGEQPGVASAGIHAALIALDVLSATVYIPGALQGHEQAVSRQHESCAESCQPIVAFIQLQERAPHPGFTMFLG